MPDIELSQADHGKAASRQADLDSRPGFGQPAPCAPAQPAERAPEANFLALQLAFDSLRGPAPAGRRSAGPGDRRLVAKAPAFMLAGEKISGYDPYIKTALSTP